jgi:alcohol dehydrogenase class IV
LTAITEFRIPELIIYGPGSFSRVGIQAALRGRKAMIISDRIMKNSGVVDRCMAFLEEANVSHVEYLDVNSEPTNVHVSEAQELFSRQQCDVLIAVGGGSCLDTAKAVSILASNGGQISDYANGQKSIKNPPIPLIAVPTTAGTGSEATSVTVIIDNSSHVKMMIKEPSLIPAVAIVDPELTVTSPPHVTAATGIDALCHAIEAYLSRRAQPITDVLALSAIELICGNLYKSFLDGTDLDARENMLRASLLAGMAFTNASVCLVHGMSRPIGAMFQVPHGVSNAMLLPAVLEYSRDHCIPRLAVIGKLLMPDMKDLTDEGAADFAIHTVKQLCLDLQIPNLKDWGIAQAELYQSVSKMATDALLSGSPQNNPKIPSHEEIVELYHYCYDYSFGTEHVMLQKS